MRARGLVARDDALIDGRHYAHRGCGDENGRVRAGVAQDGYSHMSYTSFDLLVSPPSSVE